MAREDFKGKMVFLEGSGSICGIFEWREALARKNIALAKFQNVWWIF
jgi:hypothetical protein